MGFFLFFKIIVTVSGKTDLLADLLNFQYKAFYTENNPEHDYEFTSLYVCTLTLSPSSEVSQAISASLSRYKPSLVEAIVYTEGVYSTVQAVQAAVFESLVQTRLRCVLPLIPEGWRLSSLLSPKEDDG